ncbi:malto-oligosyltrehalose trehalohydrolase [candidate division FCPU426 bacterium]|nr:malto-oligosyltrehalose trehalohydrolase [candidate division FCPU426 bacterium]
MKVGAHFLQNQTCAFTVWAPQAKHVRLQLYSPARKLIPMIKTENGYWQATAKVAGKTLYAYVLDNKKPLPDPASHYQPRGVHGPSQTVRHDVFPWKDQRWKGIGLSQMVVYELHVGTFTPQGTLAAIIPRLPAIKALGVTVLEIMPVAAFPGARNWGYDGVYPYAVQHTYGGPEGLKKLVNACHQLGLAVMLDVVYNHLGPEGNHFHEFGPYFSDRYQTPWGRAINFDDAHSDEVRNFFIQNALHWYENYHVDALRLDAIQAIFDQSAYPFLAELSDQVRAFSRKQGRRHWLIAESDLNDTRVLQPVAQGGLGMDACWCDDLHHSLHALSIGGRGDYYTDFGSPNMLYKSLRDGFACAGQYSTFRKRRYGTPRPRKPGRNLVVYAQNHDQTGNRPDGGRLAKLADAAVARWAAGLVLLSPFIPLLFMGEEYGEQAPFYFFVDHSDPKLIAAVRKGRQRGFKAFAWQGKMADPASRQTFIRSRLHWEKRRQPKHRRVLDFYRRLLKLRASMLAGPAPEHIGIKVRQHAAGRVITLHWQALSKQMFCLFHCHAKMLSWKAVMPGGRWKKMLDSSAGEQVRQELPRQLSAGTPIILQRWHTAVYIKER